MKNKMNLFLAFITIISALSHNAIKSDALWEGTWVNKTKHSWWPISQIYRNPNKHEIWISSYDTNTKRCSKRRVLRARKSRINCHVTIGFTDNPQSNDILCAPTQEFYLPETADWIPAYKLKIGDKLLSDCHVLKTIRNIDLFNKPLNVNSIEIEEEHNFLVGRDSILTHNSAIEASLQIFMEIGEGAATGAAAGSFFGPVGWAGGILLGSAFGVALCSSTSAGDRHDPHYDFRDYKRVFNEGAAAAGGGDPEGPWDPKNRGGASSPQGPKESEKLKTPNQESREKARELGYKLDKNPPFNTHGEPAYKNGQRWISRDIDAHKGGYWKMFDKYKRLGTYDKNLKIRIGN